MFQMYFMVTFELFTHVWHILVLMLTNELSWNAFKTLNKFNKFWLKKLKSHHFKIRRLNGVKV